MTALLIYMPIWCTGILKSALRLPLFDITFHQNRPSFCSKSSSKINHSLKHFLIMTRSILGDSIF